MQRAKAPVKSSVHSKKVNPSYAQNNKIDPNIDPKMRGPAGLIAATNGMQYQFLNSYSAVGDSAVKTPANRMFAQAVTQDMKKRFQASQNILGTTKLQIALNEKSGSGKSNFVTTQENYTTDYFQLPSTLNTFIPNFSKENLPYYIGGMLILYIVFFKH